jgi:hypothetical protein
MPCEQFVGRQMRKHFSRTEDAIEQDARADHSTSPSSPRHSSTSASWTKAPSHSTASSKRRKHSRRLLTDADRLLS